MVVLCWSCGSGDTLNADNALSQGWDVAVPLRRCHRFCTAGNRPLTLLCGPGGEIVKEADVCPVRGSVAAAWYRSLEEVVGGSRSRLHLAAVAAVKGVSWKGRPRDSPANVCQTGLAFVDLEPSHRATLLFMEETGAGHDDNLALEVSVRSSSLRHYTGDPNTYRFMRNRRVETQAQRDHRSRVFVLACASASSVEPHPFDYYVVVESKLYPSFLGVSPSQLKIMLQIAATDGSTTHRGQRAHIFVTPGDVRLYLRKYYRANTRHLSAVRSLEESWLGPNNLVEANNAARLRLLLRNHATVDALTFDSSTDAIVTKRRRVDDPFSEKHAVGVQLKTFIALKCGSLVARLHRATKSGAYKDDSSFDFIIASSPPTSTLNNVVYAIPKAALISATSAKFPELRISRDGALSPASSWAAPYRVPFPGSRVPVGKQFVDLFFPGVAATHSSLVTAAVLEKGGLYIKAVVAKTFGRRVYYGTVTKFDHPYWLIVYPADNDKEEWDWKELREGLQKAEQGSK